MSIISDWLKDSFNDVSRYVAKQIAPSLGIDPTKIDTEMPTPSTALAEWAKPGLEKVTSIPGVAPFLKGVYTVYEEAYRRPITTAMLLAGNIDKYSDESQGTFRSIKDIKDAYYDTKNIPEENIKGIGLTQAFAEVTGQPIRAYVKSQEEILNPEQYDELNKNVQKYIPWAAPQFDITDPKARKEIFEETWSGSLFTGGLSLIQVWAEGAGTAKLVRLLGESAGVTQTARGAKEALKVQGSEAINWIDNGAQGTAPNGLSIHYKQAVDEVSPTVIRETNPLVTELPPEMQARASVLLSEAKTAKEVDLIVRSHWNDSEAFDELWKIKAPAADALDDFGIFQWQNGPLAPISDINRASKINAVVASIAKNNPQLAKIVESWAIDLGQGIGFMDWAPSKFVTIEKARKFRKDIQFSKRYGNVLQANRLDGQVSVTTIQDNIYTRAIHVVQNLFNEAPRYYINYSDPRGIADAAIEIISEVNRVKYLRGNPRLQEYTAAYGAATTDIQRKLILEAIEKDVITNIGAQYNLSAEIAEQLYNQFKANRSAAQGTIGKQGSMELPDTSVLLPDPWVRSQLADTHILLDFKLFDRAVKEYVKKKKTSIRNTLFATGEFFDYMNSIFSHAVLIRPGYIPKNAIVEPMMRMVAIGDAAAVANDLLPATRNFLINNVNRGRLTADVLLDAVKGRSSKRLQQRIAAAESDKRLNVNELKKLQKEVKDIDVKISQLEVKQATFGPDDLDEFNINKLKDQRQDIVDKAVLINQNVDNLNANIQTFYDELSAQSEFRSKLQQKESLIEKDETFTVKVNGKTEKITVPGGLATKAKGGLAMRSEIDPSAATWAAANQSYGMARYNAIAKQTEFTKVRPGSEDYWPSMAKELNVNAKNDELVKMWANGVDRKDALAWLNGSKDIVVNGEKIGKESGKNYKKLILEANPEYKLHSFETQFVNDVYDRYDILIPDLDIRPQFTARNVSPKELEARYSLREDLPVIEGNKSIYAVTRFQKYQASLSNLSRLGYQAITAPERILFRNTFFTRKWKESIQRQIEQAEAFGVEVTSQLVNDRFRFIANAEAIRAVEQTFYTVRRLNNLNYALRFFAGFPTAILNSYKFWAKSIAKNPYNAVLQYKFQNLPYESPKIFDIIPGDTYDAGIVVDQDGNKVGKDKPRAEGEQRFLILGKPAWSSKEGLEPYTKKIDVDQWNFLLGAPSASWLFQIGISNLVGNKPEWEKYFKEYLGESVYNKILYGGRPTKGKDVFERVSNVFTPGWFDASVPLLKQAYNAAFNEAFKDEQAFAQKYWMIHSTAMINWANQGYPKGQEPSEKELRKQVYWEMVQDLGEKFFSPLGISSQPTSQIARDTRQTFVKRFESGEMPLPEGKTPFQAATELMNEIYGIDINRYFVSSYKKSSTMEASQEAYDVFRKHKPLVDKVADIDPMLIGIITNPDTPGEYSPAVGSWMQSAFASNNPLSGGKKTAEEAEKEFQIRAGWTEYIKLKDKYDSLLAQSGAKSYSKNPALKSKLEEEKKILAGKYPSWFDAYGSGVNVSSDKAIKVIVAALMDPAYINYRKDSRKWQAITTWFFEREQVVKSLNANRGNKGITKKIKSDWEDRQQEIINSDTKFAELHAQYLDNDTLNTGLDTFIESLGIK